ncbi:MAG: glycosyltransferase [Calditrichaeota bacterium]|nr:glycosyltransferase [Calditrichota bacterium]
MSRSDLHIHSKFSAKSTNFFLRKLSAGESMTDPRAAYELAKRRGMDFVALTDTDTLDGFAQIAQFPDAIPACETSVIFPEDGRPLRLLIYGLTESQLIKILAFRGQLYDVRDYLLAENLYHVVAQPLEPHDGMLNADHVERMLLLFDHFETRSTGRQERSNLFMAALLDALTPEYLDQLVRKWKIEPASERPWQKGQFGGSNDYCAQYAGLTWTETPSASSPTELLDHLRARKGVPSGMHGSTMAAAHSMYRVGAQLYAEKVLKREGAIHGILELIVNHVLTPERPKPKLVARSLWNGFKGLFKIRKAPSPIERKIITEIYRAYRELPKEDRLTGIGRDDLETFDARLYGMADLILSKLSYRLLSEAMKDFERGQIGNALQQSAALIPIQSVMTPYLYSFDKLNRDRALIKEIETRTQGVLELPRKSPRKKVAWFSDTVSDVNGVSMTLARMSEVAETLDEDLEIICSVAQARAPQGSKFRNFAPVGEISIPDYELQKLSVPPILRIIRYLEAQQFDEYIISTPGPIGLIAIYCAKLFKVPVRSIYHSDFPRHVRQITGDESLEETTWKFMRWFYGLSDAVYSPSDHYRKQLIEHGFNPRRLFLYTRGTDLDFYNPRHRDEDFYKPFGVQNRVIFVYTGRVSREKNLDVVIDAFAGDEVLKERAALAIVGDGPYREELMKRDLPPMIVFPGFVKGKELARAYASGDVFVFPSTTDTYGNSVLEAQASGLPALVSNEGGPKEIILPDESGYVLSGYDVRAWREAMHALVVSDDLRHRMAAAARARAATRDWSTAFREFWDEDPYPREDEQVRAIVIA